VGAAWCIAARRKRCASQRESAVRSLSVSVSVCESVCLWQPVKEVLVALVLMLVLTKS
jgi:hypothetical protein